MQMDTSRPVFGRKKLVTASISMLRILEMDTILVRYRMAKKQMIGQKNVQKYW